jgi:hypothetical protein
MFCVIHGQGVVSGADGRSHPIESGQAAVWQAEESHEASTDSGMIVIVVELASIQTTEGRT